jgi:protein-S-isoprenylcysteine O-methyltransferase Ste14
MPMQPETKTNSFIMDIILIFAILSLPIIIVSWRTLFKVRSHGFYRFFSWECISLLFAFNYKYWFTNPFSIKQIFSWIFLVVSLYLIIAGVIMMKKHGKAGSDRKNKSLYRFEQTSELVDTGIFRYIRHPLYSSLLFLTWGIFLKNTTILLLIVALASSFFLYITARYDENECMACFGEHYREYMKRSKRFIPFIF